MMARFRDLAAALSTSVCIVALAAPAQAQDRNFNVPAGSLREALDAYVAQSGTQLIYQPGDLGSAKSKGAQGSMSAREALDRILANSGFRVVTDQSGALAIASAVGNASAAADAASNGEVAPRGVISGKVVDSRTGAALKGALVEIVESGKSGSTDDLGEYRFTGNPEGSYTVRVSYLGYQETTATAVLSVSSGARQSFLLQGGSSDAEIVVYGQRSARAQALNQERTAENTQTVLSSDLLGRFEGSTIAESLRRVPGVAFEQDAVTGDGANIIVRGLEPDFNTVTLNGLRLPEGSGTGRSPSLANILTDSISKVTINKSLLPSHDSSGTGGLIDIETKGPLDRPHRYANFGFEVARSGKGFLKEFTVNGTVSATFGADENIGLSASVQYRKRDIRRYDYSVSNNYLFPYLPLREDGTPFTNPFEIDPERNYPFEEGVDTVFPDSVATGYNGAENSNLAITLSGQWKIADHTQLRVDFVRSKSVRDEFTRSTNFIPFHVYELLPIDELGGEVRAALVTHDAFAASGFPGTFVNATQGYTFLKGVESKSDVYSFQGKTALGPWDINYTFGYADGSSVTPLDARLFLNWNFSNFLNAAFTTSELSSDAFSNVTSDGRPVGLFAPMVGNHFPVPLLTLEGFARLGNEAEWELDPNNGAVVTVGRKGSNKRYTAKGNVRRSFNSDWLKYVEAGWFFENAKFANAPVPSEDLFDVLPLDFGTIVTLADLGLPFSGTTLDALGIAGGADVVSQQDVEDFFANLAEIAANNPNLRRRTFSPSDPRAQETFTKEKNLSFYLMPRIDIGKLEIVGGARFDKIRIRTRGLLNPSLIDANGVTDVEYGRRNSALADGFANQTRLLPRLAATFRQSDDLLFRAAFGLSIGRPQIQFLTGAQQVNIDLRPRYGPNFDQPRLTVQKTNPHLKPAITKNYELDIEKYFKDIGQIKLSLFYKTIENMLGLAISDTSTSLDGVVVPDDPRIPPTSEFFVRTTQLVNGKNPAKTYGAELAVERQFTFLPGILNGLGFYGNYTYTKGKREFLTVENNQNVKRKVPLSGSPKHSGTAAITYNKYGIDASLAFTMQGRRFDSADRFGFDRYSEADNSLDFRAEYRFKPRFGEWRIYVEASDLLKGPEDADVISTQGGAHGVPKIFIGGNYYGGRRLTFGVSTSL